MIGHPREVWLLEMPAQIAQTEIPDPAAALSRNLHKTCSRLVYGCAHLADARTLIPGSRTSERILSWLDKVYAAGCTIFDTAAIYGFGGSERLLGAWIKSRDLREQVVIATKGCHPTLLGRRRVTMRDLEADLNASLDRLQTDYLDIFFLHRDDPSMPAAEVIEICARVLNAENVRMLGVSNWTHERISEANAHAKESGLRPIQISSPHLSLADWRRSPWPNCVSISGAEGRAARAWYTRTGLPVFAWSSLAQGFLSGRYGSGAQPGLRSLSLGRLHCLRSYGTSENFARLERAAILAEEKGINVPQIALAYLVSQPFPVFPIVSTSQERSLKENLQAVALELTDDETSWLETGG
jgi:aryl-alcohol dehydrogenase-like predicted oxidoreductase